VSRAIDRLAQDAVAALCAINTARAAARARVWKLAGEHVPDHGIGPDENRVRAAKDNGLTNLPLHELNQNKIWCTAFRASTGMTPR
jgi:hypothetical protein